MTAIHQSRAIADAAVEKLRVFAQPQRLMILSYLLGGERQVADIEAATGVTQPALSQQLAELRRAELVKTRREAKQVHYRLADDAAAMCVRTLEAIDHREAFGLNWDPSHMVWQGLDPVAFILDFADRIYHVDCKDTRMRMGNGRNGILGSHRPWADPRRGWDFVSTGRGDVPWEDAIRALNSIGYDGPISVEWEDAGMDRLQGAPAGLEYVRSLLWNVPTGSFDDAFAAKD